MPRNSFWTSLISATIAAPGIAMAHTAILACYDNGDETILCEAGYSDGSTSAGQTIHVVDQAGHVLIDDVFDDDGQFGFPTPTEPGFAVEFIGDVSHKATVFDDEIY